MPILKYTVSKNIDLIKLANIKGIDSQNLKKSLAIGGILVNNKRIKKIDTKLKKGDRVSICLDENPPEFEFSKDWIVYEDEYLIIVNKPQGITTQGTMCYDINHLYYFVKQYLNGYAGLHHRLDRDTSGLVLFTKKKEVNKEVAKLFKNREIKKYYITIVHGRLERKKEINQPIGLIPESNPKKWWVNMPESKQAITIVKPIEVLKNFTLIEAMPLTGRTHQIRVHLSSIGHPILGDKFYNQEEKSNYSLMLHCKKLEFNHPVTKKKVTIETDMPERFKDLLKKEKE
ncbi:23S rRNA pseudouridine1911/1915/1917 synthase [Thermotomaculum hydrothermale]|uniref:Pseudouridine synthase n=1 Tax=Thermotomaculum hydrothermale TaxID=981385 RepID=A0A7R6PPF7_9BACT|nr:RluA family pseudouridine synthase [Thermotomaculum hydrothermale]BBB32871.1 23S rRNA pseudouridine1911/1915/1917 synthase [Thermotomaculum hydrothermale]